VDIVNDLDLAVSQGESPEQIGQIFDELLSYTSWHFHHEERLMQTYVYPGMFEHKDEHESLLKQAADLSNDFQNGDHSVPANSLPFLKTWLADHIMGTDKKMGEYLAENAG
jgi:hemerythrin